MGELFILVVVAEAEAEEEKPKEEVGEIESLKKALVDSFYGTDRGWKASSETRAEIVELITLLEAKNPTPAPTDSLPLLNGKWILAYTSFTGLFPLLSRGQLRLVKVEEISQTIDAESLTVQNSVQFSGPLASSSISASAKFEVRSPRRVQIKFQEGIIGTPQLTDSIVLPENVEFMGQNIDLAPIKGLLNSVLDTASTVAKTISSRPPLKFSLSNSNSESWLLTTYLDEDLRISRDGGSVFVLIKEGNDDEGSPDKKEEVMEDPETESGGVIVAEAEAEEEKPKEEVGEIESLKKALVDSFYGTDRGWKASSETRAEIVELITLLEAKNPTPAPTDSLPLLNGKWILSK
ncbi:hypothetical protein GOBAR_DD21032 [Gossypium barbadense]|nr:hypothetical protein GOBAR_DD21032 [Gossypium barbadense]